MHLLVIIGAPAVGKMTVGAEVGTLTGWPLFHNHQAMEPFLGIFAWGTPAFRRLRDETRRRVRDEALAADLPGLVFTYALALDLPEDLSYLEEYVAPVLAAGGTVDVAELRAPLAVRLSREGAEDRVAAKPSKRDVAWAREHVVEMEQHRWHTEGEHIGPGRHVVVENAHADPAGTAREIVRLLDLPLSPRDE